MLSKGWKCYFRDPIFQNLPEEHAHGLPNPLGARDYLPPPPPLPPYESNLAKALQCMRVMLSHDL